MKNEINSKEQRESADVRCSSVAPCYTVLDLFSGIGGFSLGLERTGGFRTIAFCEIDQYCRGVLSRHWPETPIFQDIKDVKNVKTDIVVGGFPCQPFSTAGKQRGKEDDRYLWPEMLRVIGESRPTWIIAENVVGLLRMGIDTMLLDLETEGYTTRPVIIPACGKNASHRRDRIWILAYSESNRDSRRPEEVGRKKEETQKLRVQPYDQGANGRWEKQGTSESKFCRTFNGVPNKLDKARIKALGNAVHPKIPMAIGQAILDV